ncbi:MAG TPA: mevalonate kinase [Oceanospirillaceae bacterium]|nr:mevalonate kinase [Oceanospirillaceae bacterium]
MVFNSLTCSAPGSTIIMGEHAVLHGYPAIVAALDARLSVRLSGLEQAQLQIDSSVGAWQSSLSEALEVGLHQQPLRFVLAALQFYSTGVKALPGLHIKIDSAIDPSMGLGSSAALTVALVGALRAWLGQDHGHHPTQDKQQTLEDAVSIIRNVQGRGSGADAAASCYGGLVRFDAEHRQAKALLSGSGAPALPDLRLIYTGYKTPTPQVIAQVAQWAQAEPQRYKQIYATMGGLVKQTEAAIGLADWSAMAAAMNAYQQQMQALGVCDKGTQSAIDAAWRAVDSAPNKHDLAVKISGSGLGDCILGLGIPHVPAWPHKQFALPISASGLTYQNT